MSEHFLGSSKTFEILANLWLDPLPSCVPHIPLRFAKIPPQKVEYVRCDSRRLFFLIPIHGEGIRKKNPSRWNGLEGFWQIGSFIVVCEQLIVCVQYLKSCLIVDVMSKRRRHV